MSKGLYGGKPALALAYTIAYWPCARRPTDSWPPSHSPP